MNKFICMLSIAVFFFAGASSLCAEPQIVTRVEYYDIQGSTKEELRQDMRRKTHDPGGRYGYTAWSYKWGMKGMQSLPGGGCRVDGLYVTGEVVMYLPRWKGANALTPMGREWNKFSKALLKHEEGHQKINLEAIKAIDRKLFETAEAHAGENCGRLNSQLNNAINLEFAEYNRRNSMYDVETQHGKTQGATF